MYVSLVWKFIKDFPFEVVHTDLFTSWNFGSCSSTAICTWFGKFLFFKFKNRTIIIFESNTIPNKWIVFKSFNVPNETLWLSLFNLTFPHSRHILWLVTSIFLINILNHSCYTIHTVLSWQCWHKFRLMFPAAVKAIGISEEFIEIA